MEPEPENHNLRGSNLFKTEFDGVSKVGPLAKQKDAAELKNNVEAYPNPINSDSRDELILSIKTKEKDRFTVDMFNVQGRKVKNLLENEKLNVGESTFEKNIKSLEPGVYFLNVKGSRFSTTEKLIIE